MGARVPALVRTRPSLVGLDRVLAVLLALDALLEVWLAGDGDGHRIAVALLAPALTLPIAVRRRYPLLVGAGIPVLAAFEHTYWPAQAIAYPIAEFCALYALAVWTTPRRFLAGCGIFALSNLAPWSGLSTGGAAFVVVALVVMVLGRRIVGDRERRAALAERERDLAAREAVVEERARIARELHDAIAHNVSMMVVQAGAERRVLGEEHSSTREVLTTVEQIGRSALTEMRRLVGMLRSDQDDPLTPQPGLRDLPRLADQVREAGLPIELTVEGEPRELPIGLELSAYRIVQEALTNALKHAGEARATVRVVYAPDSLELEIADDGGGVDSAEPHKSGGTGFAGAGAGKRAPALATASAGGGHGLVGMRERVALYGGRFEASRRAAGGFAVRVVLPIR